MPSVGTQRVSRELLLAAVGRSLEVEPWVIDRLTASLEEQEAVAGDYVFAAGEVPDYLYFLRRGRLELLRNGESVETLEGPHAFGMLDMLLERPRSVSACARTPLELMRVRADAWLDLLEDSFELARMSVGGLARGVCALEEKLWASGRHLKPPTPLVVDASRGAKLDVLERLAILMRAPLLRGAGVQPVSDLASVSEEVEFASGELLVDRESPPGRVFVLIDGQVHARKEDSRASWQGGPGEMVCGAAALGEKSSEWDARAVVPTRALAFGVDDWFDVMEENFEMVRSALVALATEHKLLAEEVARPHRMGAAS